MRFYCFAVLVGSALIAYDCHASGNLYQFQPIGRGCVHVYVFGGLLALHCLLAAVCLACGMLAVLLFLFPLLALLFYLFGIVAKLCEDICCKLQDLNIFITVITII